MLERFSALFMCISLFKRSVPPPPPLTSARCAPCAQNPLPPVLLPARRSNKPWPPCNYPPCLNNRTSIPTRSNISINIETLHAPPPPSFAPSLLLSEFAAIGYKNIVFFLWNIFVIVVSHVIDLNKYRY
jgi:hypothetical protein